MRYEELEDAVGAGEIDTVVVAFCDMQGRLVGKRVTGHFFCDEVAHAGIEACNYLLAVDVDMTPLPGYRFANWEQGYGDVRAVPDLTTLRRVPWLEATALVLCDLVEVGTAAPVEVSPRRILQRQIERARQAGFTVKVGAELELYLFKDSYDEAFAKGYRNLVPHSAWVQDYHVLQTTRDEYLIRRIRNGMDGAGIPVEFSKGEAGRGQHEINLRYADALEMADRHAIYKNGAKEIAALAGRSITFMAKWSADECGSSCHLHTSLWSVDGTEPRSWSDRDPDHMSEPFRHWVGGQLACARELVLCFAPFVNSYKRFVAGSWAPTAVAWGHDNRTCGLRVVGHGPSFRVESRIPGADCNPYVAYAATIAAGLHGIDQRIDPGPPWEGNAYEADSLLRLPTTLAEAIELFAGSRVALAAFGPEVHHHLLNGARKEWEAASRAVTDWELVRNFERI
jgi:glutamine synthetase